MSTSDQTNSSGGTQKPGQFRPDSLLEAFFGAAADKLVDGMVGVSGEPTGKVDETERRKKPSAERWSSSYTRVVVAQLTRLRDAVAARFAHEYHIETIDRARNLLADYWLSMHKIYEERDAAIRERDELKRQGADIVARGKSIAAKADAVLGDALKAKEMIENLEKQVAELTRQRDFWREHHRRASDTRREALNGYIKAAGQLNEAVAIRERQAARIRELEAQLRDAEEGKKFWYQRWTAVCAQRANSTASKAELQEKANPHTQQQNLPRTCGKTWEAFGQTARCTRPAYHTGMCVFESVTR